MHPLAINQSRNSHGWLARCLLETGDGLGVHQRQADIVQTVEQAMLAERIDFKAQDLAIRAGHGLRLQIDTQLITGLGFHLLEQLIDVFLDRMIGNKPFLKLLLKKMSA